MEMHQIRYFLAVAQSLNFTQAARDCNVAQPSLSRAIKLLEDELGGALFRRERALTHLTELGRMMQPLLKQCFDNATAAKHLAAAYRKGVTAPVRVAVSNTVTLILLIPSLTELARVFPGLEFVFVRGTGAQILEHLKAGAVDLAVAAALGDWERLDQWRLFEEGYVLVLHRTHPLAMRNRLSLADLQGTRLLARAYDENAGAVTELLKAAGIEQKAGDHVVSDQDLLTLIEANLGTAIMPHSSSGASTLISKPVEGLTLRRQVSLYAAAGRERSPAASALMKLLRAIDWEAMPLVARGEALPA